MYCASVYYMTVWNGVSAPHGRNLDEDGFSVYVTNYICGRNFPSRSE